MLDRTVDGTAELARWFWLLDGASTEELMLLIVAVVVALIAVAFLSRRRQRANATTLGFMSAKWVAEHRASRPNP